MDLIEENSPVASIAQIPLPRPALLARGAQGLPLQPCKLGLQMATQNRSSSSGWFRASDCLGNPAGFSLKTQHCPWGDGCSQRPAGHVRNIVSLL